MEDRSSLIPRFARGLSILLVDYDATSLMYLSSMLEQYAYKARTALSMIGERKDRFKLVMANVNMPDMDSLEFLRVVLEKDIPVILISSRRSISAARKAIAEGASFYLNRPIYLDDLKYIWQHTFRKKRSGNSTDTKGRDKDEEVKDKHKKMDHNRNLKRRRTENLEISENTCVGKLTTADHSIQKENGSKSKKLNEHVKEKRARIIFEEVNNFTWRKTIEEEIGKKNCNSNSKSSSSEKRSRIVWTPDLHLKFTSAISALGDKNARPKPILEIMNVPHLTHRQVASHLQKYKSQVQRICETGTTNLPAVSRSSNFYGRTRVFETLEKKTSALNNYQPIQSSDFGINGSIFEILTASSNICTPFLTSSCATSQNNNQVSATSSRTAPELDSMAGFEFPAYSMDGNQKLDFIADEFPTNLIDGNNQLQEEEIKNVIQVSNNNSGGDEPDNAFCFDDWIGEILNPDSGEVPDLDKIMTGSDLSKSETRGRKQKQLDSEAVSATDAYAHVMDILKEEPADGIKGLAGETNPDDVDRYCKWLTDALHNSS